MKSLPSRGLGRWIRTISAVVRRRKLLPAIEVTVVLWLLVTMLASYLVLAGGKPGEDLLTPPLAGLLLVANLIPAIALLVLAGRRFAYARAARTPLRGTGRLHSRLVGLFSTIAAIPVLLLVIFSSLLFQYGFDFWFSQKARSIMENSSTLAQNYYQEKRSVLISKTEIMASDVGQNLLLAPISSDDFQSSFGYQVYARELSQGIIFSVNPNGDQRSLVFASREADSPRYKEKDNWIAKSVIAAIRGGKTTIVQDWGNRMEAFTAIPNQKATYLYTLSLPNSEGLEQAKRYSTVLSDYRALLNRSRTLQLQFHGALFFIALLVVGAAVAIALNVADRVVQPIGELVDAARKVSAGDLSARVRGTTSRDEIGTLGNAFNLMTQRLEGQRAELVDANSLLDRRRALIEAVIGSVTAGVIAVTKEGDIRILNRRALEILRLGEESVLGDQLANHAPDFAKMLAEKQRNAVMDVLAGHERRTLAVTLVDDDIGHVITFDDITDQLADQRSAAWSDVARRIAHEIKNPLTPIQLAAERLRRRFAKDEAVDPATVERLTDTIIRQVGDLRRMVDEFSSFARMPKPVFQEESLVDICRQAMFLQEVAHSGIRFELKTPDPHPVIICDRRQLGQALTNILKNAVEAIEQRVERDGPGEQCISVEISGTHDTMISLSVADTGIGLPAERDRIVEPYMTTRKSGTGLGLAIVKKIIEEHGGEMSFADAADGGTVVTMCFHPESIQGLAFRAEGAGQLERESGPAILTRTEMN